MSTAPDKTIARIVLGAGLAILAGYLGLAWAILHKKRPITTPPIAPTRRRYP